MLRILAAAVLALAALAGCTGSDTYYDVRSGWIYEPYGTANDCKIAAKRHGPQNVWRGLAGGRQHLGFGQYRNISREACFETEAACRYWAAQMDGALYRVTTLSCKKGYGR